MVEETRIRIKKIVRLKEDVGGTEGGNVREERREEGGMKLA